MWDNHQALDLLASSLFAVTGLMVLYAINEWTGNSPVFPLKEVMVSAMIDSKGDIRHVKRDQVSCGDRS